jgi:uncharacterized protein YneF (UPF0154 family)
MVDTIIILLLVIALVAMVIGYFISQNIEDL